MVLIRTKKRASRIVLTSVPSADTWIVSSIAFGCRMALAARCQLFAGTNLDAGESGNLLLVPAGRPTCSSPRHNGVANRSLSRGPAPNHLGHATIGQPI